MRHPVVQAKLRVGAPDDKYEQEADRVADQVMRLPEPASVAEPAGAAFARTPTVQRKCAACGSSGKPCPECADEDDSPNQDDDELQAKAAPGKTPTAPAATEGKIAALKTGGQPFAPATRAFFEPRFGADFSAVRVHADASAGGIAQSIQARAFTHGSSIFFAPGMYDVHSIAGRSLIAHELTHVLQQASGSRKIQRQETEEDETAPLPLVIDLNRPLPPRWLELMTEIRSDTGLALSLTLNAAWNHLERHRPLARQEVDEALALAERLRGFFVCPETSASTVRHSTSLADELEALRGMMEIESSEDLDTAITQSFEALADYVLLLEPTFRDIDEGRIRGCLTSRLGPFATGLLDGLRQFGDDETRALLNRLAANALFNVVFPPVMLTGTTVGIAEDALAVLTDVWKAVTSPVQAARDAIASLEAFAELMDELASLDGAALAEDLGRQAGQALVAELRRLNATSNVAVFSFELGRLIGPAVVYTILSFLGFEAFVAGRLLLWSRSAMQGLRSLRAFRRLETLLPHRLPSVPDIDAPGTGNRLRRADLPDNWQRVLTDDDVDFLESTRNIDSAAMPDALAESELELALRGPSRSINADGYVEEIELPNGHHHWRRQPDDTWCRFSTRKCIRRRDRHTEGSQVRELPGQQGFTPQRIAALRQEVVRRPAVERIVRTGHAGAEDHGVPDEIILRAIRDPQQVRIASNGNWVFYRNGTIVVTPARYVDADGAADIITAFGNGGSVPPRHVTRLRLEYNNPDLTTGDPELPIDLDTYIEQNRGSIFDSFRIWP